LKDETDHATTVETFLARDIGREQAAG
jgi:hypothetical protein